MRTATFKAFGLMALLAALAVWMLAGCQSVFGSYHTVKPGETLYSLSRAYNVPIDTLKRVNYLRDPAYLIPGEKLFIPGADATRDGYPKSKAVTKTGPKMAPSSNDNSGKRALALSGQNRGERVENSQGFIWPTDGVLSSNFGDRWGRRHNGIDLSAPDGTPIYAAAGGRVAYAASDQRGYGNIIILEHSEGFLTIYAHNAENLVKEGDTVRKGDLIGRVGRTGNAQGSHLHFEIRLHREAVDPLKYLP